MATTIKKINNAVQSTITGPERMAIANLTGTDWEYTTPNDLKAFINHNAFANAYHTAIVAPSVGVPAAIAFTGSSTLNGIAKDGAGLFTFNETGKYVYVLRAGLDNGSSNTGFVSLWAEINAAVSKDHFSRLHIVSGTGTKQDFIDLVGVIDVDSAPLTAKFFIGADIAGVQLRGWTDDISGIAVDAAAIKIVKIQ